MHTFYPRPSATPRLRTVRHIATSQTIAGMRSCPSRLYPQRQQLDQARMVTGYAHMQIREQQRRHR